jgi:hypothetical protein
MPNIIIDLAAEFTGRKAFNDAGKSTSSLEKSVKSLGRTFAVTFGTAAVLAYGKASVKAAAADQKAQQQLALALKNVGLSRDAATAEGYIQRIEKELGIVDDKLRPAYSNLVIATRDYNETQRLMGIAMDISANKGKDLELVSSALAKAYLGNNTALGKLNIGISKADLASKSYKEITDELAITFAGSAKLSAESFAGSIDKLSIASNNAKEVIGTSLINALAAFSGKKGVDGAVSSIDKLASGISSTVTGTAYLVKEIKIAKPILVGAGVAIMLAWAPWFTAITAAVALVGYIGNALKANAGFQGMGNVAMTGGSNMDTQRADKAAAAKAVAAGKAAAAAKIKADKLAAAAKIKADKNAADNAAKLAKAGAMFDLDKIQIEAALKGKITDEETLRLQLQRAILNEDATLADQLQKKLEASQRATAALQGQINGIKPLADPFSAWLLTLEGIADTLTAISKTSFNSTVPTDIIQLDAKGNKKSETLITNNPEPIPVVVAPSPSPSPTPITNNPMAGLGGTDYSGYNRSFSVPGYSYTAPPVTVNLTVQGSVIAEQELVKVVNDAVITANTQGLNTRRPGGLVPTE